MFYALAFEQVFKLICIITTGKQQSLAVEVSST